MCTIVHFTVLCRLRTGYTSTSEWWHHLKYVQESQNLFLALSLKMKSDLIFELCCGDEEGWGLRSAGIPFPRVLDSFFWGVRLGEAGKDSFWFLKIFYYFWGLGVVCKKNVWKSVFLFPYHNLTLTCWSWSSSDDTPSKTSSTVRSTHSVPSSLESHLSSSVWFSVFRAFRRPKMWLVNCGPTPPSARRDAIPTTEPKARLRFPWSRSSRLLVSE